MRLSRRARYALCAIFDLAYNGAGEPVRVQKIGERQAISYRFLEQIFQDLRRAELVAGRRGPGGGGGCAGADSQPGQSQSALSTMVQPSPRTAFA